MIGETLMQSGAEGIVGPYIPFYFKGYEFSKVGLKYVKLCCFT